MLSCEGRGGGLRKARTHVPDIIGGRGADCVAALEIIAAHLRAEAVCEHRPSRLRKRYRR